MGMTKFMKSKNLMKYARCAVLVGVCFLFTVANASAGICDFNSNFGKVKRVYPQWQSNALAGTYFSLHPGITNAVVGNAYYFIPALPNASLSAQSLYRSLHDLLLEAAKSGWTVNVRTTNCATPAIYPAYAPVAYLFVDFP